jgi:hypothetical protein
LTSITLPEAIRKYFLEHLKHLESVQYREITKAEQGYTTEVTGGLLMREKREYGWTAKTTIDTKTSHDSYVGFKTYSFLFRDEKIVDARLHLPGDEMNCVDASLATVAEEWPIDWLT